MSDAMSGPNRFIRTAEVVGFYFGLFIILGDKAVEWLCRWNEGIDCGGFDFGTFAYATLLIAPLMLGKATAGKVWESIPGVVTSMKSMIIRRPTTVVPKPKEGDDVPR